MEDERATEAFNKIMLNTLLVEFFRDVNLQFDVVNNSKFRALCRFICPLIKLPIPQELVSLNSNNYILFKIWDEMRESSILNKQRRKYVDQWAKAEMQRENGAAGLPRAMVPEPVRPQEVSRTTRSPVFEPLPGAPKASKPVNFAEKSPVIEQLMPEAITGQESKPLEEQASPFTLWGLPRAIVEEPSGLAGSQNWPASRPTRSQVTEQLPGAPKASLAEKSPVDEPGGQRLTPSEETKPEQKIQNFPLRTPDNYEESKPTLIEDEQSEDVKPTPEELQLLGSSTAPDLFPSPPIPEYTEKQGNGIAAKLITFQDIPGYIKWPCLVCSQRREVSKLRSVNTNEAYIMLYVCVKGGQYDLRKAKELARMEKFKCCVDHLHDLYEQALQSLSIIDPRLDIHTENQKVVEAYHLVKDIKESRCTQTQKLVFEGSRKHILPFITQLRNFFLKYGRSNYTAKPGQPGYLVEPN